MPQKVCGGDILHVVAYAIFPEMPQNRTVSIMVRMLLMFRKWGISGKTNKVKVGHFRKKTRDQISAEYMFLYIGRYKTLHISRQYKPQA